MGLQETGSGTSKLDRDLHWDSTCCCQCPRCRVALRAAHSPVSGMSENLWGALAINSNHRPARGSAVACTRRNVGHAREAEGRADQFLQCLANNQLDPPAHERIEFALTTFAHITNLKANGQIPVAPRHVRAILDHASNG